MGTFLLFSVIILFVVLINDAEALPGAFIGLLTLGAIILIFTQTEMLLVGLFVLLAIGAIAFIATSPERQKSSNDIAIAKERISKEAVEFGVFNEQTKQVIPDALLNSVLSKYRMALNNDYRRMAAPDNYGRVSESRVLKWEDHLFKTIDSCKLDAKGEKARKLIKQIFYIQKTPNRELFLDSEKKYFDFIDLDLLSSENIKYDELDLLYLEEADPGLAAYKNFIISEFSIIFRDNDNFQFDESMTGLEYEKFCASLLRQDDWNVTELPASGDHGADLLASDQEVTVAIQCKKYASPLGNSPVQEVSAAKNHYNTTHSIVVTNSSYTKGATVLAKSNNVQLLHHRDLLGLRKILSDV